jgi:phytoene dehydrogenase-like protein
MSRNREIAIIGAGIGGLAAAAYLARAGFKVCVFEARPLPGGLAASEQTGQGFSMPIGVDGVHALDPRLVKELKLAKRGLRFAVRDMSLVGLRPDGRHIVLGRDVHAAGRALAVHSARDAERWPVLRREFEALARAMRKLWWEDDPSMQPAMGEARLELFRRMGAQAWLDWKLESDALKATLAFDAIEGGLSPLEPGSALTLLWRASQEMCGLQGAVAMAKGGPGALAAALCDAARVAGAEIRTGARVTAILAEGGAVTGIALASGERIGAAHVLSSLSRRRTLCELLPGTEAGFAAASDCDRAHRRVGTAKVLLGLDRLPAFGGVSAPATARFILADRMEAYASAHVSARMGRMPDEPPIAFTLPTAADPSLAPMGQHVFSAIVRPVPTSPAEGWDALKPRLLEKVTSVLAHHMPDVASHVTQAMVLTPDDYRTQYGHEDDSSSLMHILSDWRTRIETPVQGLMLCGASAEPVSSLSGRAGRIAAARIIREAKR